MFPKITFIAPAMLIMSASISAQTTAAPAPVLSAFSAESAISPGQIDLAAGAALPSDVLAALQGGSLQLRQQLSYDPAQMTLQISGILVPSATASPVPANTTGVQTLWSYSVALERVDLTTTPRQQLAFIGHIAAGQSKSALFGDLTGSIVTATASYTTPASSSAPATFQAITTSLAGAGAVFSSAGLGTLKIVNPVTAQLPLAVAGPKGNQVTTPQFTLDGTQSTDPNGSPLTYSWVFVPAAGQAVTITGANTPTPSVTISDSVFAYGEYTFQLTIVDAAGLTSSDTVTVEYVSPF